MRGLALTGVLLSATGAHAHHDAAVGRVGGAALAMASRAAGLPVPRVDVGVVWASRSFSRTLRGSDRYAGSEGGSVQVHQLSPTLAVELASGTRVQASLPVGWVRVSPKPAEAGLGDAQLALTQKLAQRVQTADAGGVRRSRGAWLTVSASAPTGRYDDTTAVSLVDVQADDDGALRVLPYDTRASLGAGAFSAGVQLAGQVRRSDWLGDGWLGASTPLQDTRDGIRWGTDLSAGVSGQRSLLSDRLQLGAGAQVSRHLSDRLLWLDVDSGEVERLAVGARSDLRALLRIGVRPTQRVRCMVQGQLPVAQHVQGTQLVETWSASLGCTLAVPWASAG